MSCLGESIAALVGKIATFEQSLRVKEKKKGLQTQLRCQGFMIGEAALPHSKGGDLLWRKLQRNCLQRAEVRDFLDHFFVDSRGWCWGGGGGSGGAGEEAFWATVGHDHFLCKGYSYFTRLV